MARKKVLVRVSALTRVECPVIVDVPADADPDQLEDLAHHIYNLAEPEKFVPDPDYWERGTHFVEDLDEDDPDPAGYVGDPVGRAGSWLINPQPPAKNASPIRTHRLREEDGA